MKYKNICLLVLISTCFGNLEASEFDALRNQKWNEVFSDDFAGDWQEKWFLDGIYAKVSTADKTLTIDTADGYAVLWTKDSIKGEGLRIEYDFQRLDDYTRGVNIIYIQATGDGEPGFDEDITEWSDKRKEAAMPLYYQNMHTYHISYAAEVPSAIKPNAEDYIRGRRYLPLNNNKMNGTVMEGEVTGAGIFRDKEWIHVTIIKREKEIWAEFKHPKKTVLCHLVNKDNPGIKKGRIGLRLMPRHLSRFKNFKVMKLDSIGGNSKTKSKKTPTVNPKAEEEARLRREYNGKVGKSGWACHIIQPDPKNAGPDGINIHDWDGDGDNDLFVNYEEGSYSRLYFNPGNKTVRKLWTDFIQFEHGKCEDSGMGDLDDDGDIDYIANGGWVYFNPGKDNVRDPSQWSKMTLFNQERRVPTVTDVDGDGLNDLIVGAQEWFKQPKTGKHKAENWVKYTIGKNRWPMNAIMYDVDKDGDTDMVVADRGIEICWYDNPGPDKVTGKWERKLLHKHNEAMFMTVADVNGDQLDDFLIAGGQKGLSKLAGKIIVLLRTNKSGDPTYKEIIIDQPTGNFPKGIAVLALDADGIKNEILVTPKQGDIWAATFKGDSMKAENWSTRVLDTPGAESRMKMDNAYLGDLDGDGDLDVLTTEENGGWGVVWFENPQM